MKLYGESKTTMKNDKQPTDYDLSGATKQGPRRVPQYVHEPEAIRDLVCVLGRFDDKSREALFLHAHRLLYKPPDIIIKCVIYAADPTMNWAVVRAALVHLLNRINRSLMHPLDHDATIPMFLFLRNYTFVIPSKEVKTFLSDYKYINHRVAHQISNYASKIASGVTPRTNTDGPHWKLDIIDDWIAEAERSMSVTSKAR
jgi:hypothetical protein